MGVFVRFSVAEVSPVSTLVVQGRALVMVVSRWPASVVAVVSLVASSPRGCVLCAKKFALRGLMVGASAKKFALQAQNGRKTLFSGALGELFRGSVGGGAAPGELFRGRAPGGPLLGGVFRGPAVEGSRWVRVWHLDVGLVPPLDLGCATDPRSRAQDLGCASRRGCPKEPQVGDPRAPFRRISAVSPKSASTPTSRGD